MAVGMRCVLVTMITITACDFNWHNIHSTAQPRLLQVKPAAELVAPVAQALCRWSSSARRLQSLLESNRIGDNAQLQTVDLLRDDVATATQQSRPTSDSRRTLEMPRRPSTEMHADTIDGYTTEPSYEFLNYVKIEPHRYRISARVASGI